MRIEDLTYLKTPDKIRAALINTVGHAPSVEAIKRRLDSMPKPLTRTVEEPKDRDAVGYVLPWRLKRTQQERERAERLAKIEAEKNRPKPAPFVHYPHTGTPQSERLANLVCEAMGLELVDFFGPTRVRQYTLARAIVARILRDRNPTIYSYPKIGACIARKDHSTVKNLLDNFPVYCRYEGFFETYEAVKKAFEESEG